jgi:Zn-dependent peptidase ImmA (M78 family)/DNA-binding XRE family transcriptional regulator
MKIMMSQRIRQLRLARGLSLAALAAEMGGIVSKQALSKYERGETRPSSVVLNKLAAALGVKAMYLHSEPNIHVQFIAYRKGSGLGVREQKRVESTVRQALEERIRLQEAVQQADGSELPIQALGVESLEDAEYAAVNLRKQWDLGLDPIANVIDVLEDHLIHVLEINASERFDGISAVAYDDRRVIAAALVARRGVAGERQRLSIAHELGHLFLKVPKNIDEERVAFRFGAAFLAPAEMVYRGVGTKRAFIQLEELLLLKRHFGVSIQALLYRLNDLGIISQSYFREWWMNINRLGWRKQEPFESAPEQPKWLRQTALRALAEGLLSQEETERILGETLKTKPPLSLIERRQFMKLPLEERRRILAEQSESMATYYDKDSEWRELEVADFVEY